MKRSDINPMPPNFAKYIDPVADVELEQAFDESGRQLNELDKGLLKNVGDKRYEPSKWSIKDILQHLADSDRIKSYQALMLARKDEKVLSGFDQELHVKNANGARRTVDEVIEEIKVARASTVFLFNSFDDEILLREAINWKYETSVLAKGFLPLLAIKLIT